MYQTIDDVCSVKHIHRMEFILLYRKTVLVRTVRVLKDYP